MWVDEAGISNDGAKWAATHRVTEDINSLLLLLKTAEKAAVLPHKSLGKYQLIDISLSSSFGVLHHCFICHVKEKLRDQTIWWSCERKEKRKGCRKEDRTEKRTEGRKEEKRKSEERKKEKGKKEKKKKVN